MQKIQRVVVPLRVLLVLAFAILVMGQVSSLPGIFVLLAQENPDLAYLRWPMFTIAMLELLCVQIVIVCTWKLLTMVKDDRIFSEDSLVWVNAIVWAIGAAWVLLLGVFVVTALVVSSPGIPALLLAILVVGAVLWLLVVVLRELLRQATTLRTDMDGVI